MATAGGPDIITDGLVFGYDTGYGIANNSTAARFYKGQPSTNNTITAGYTWWGDGSNQSFANKDHVTITDDSLKYNGYDTRLWTPGSSNNVYLNGSGDISASDVSTVWTFSCYIKRDDGAPITSLKVYMYYPNSDGSSLGTIVSMGNGWYRVSRTRTGSSSYIGLVGFTGFPSIHKYYLSGVMLTKTNQTLPYIPVQSSRSNTASLIDLKKSTNIDLSNVSFDSTGQPIFDGTDDKIDLGNLSVIRLGSNFTIEAVVRPSQDKWMYFFDKGYGINNCLTFGRHANGNWFFTTMTGGSYNYIYFGTAVVNEWWHLVATYDGSSVRVYENGILKSTYGATHDMMTSSDSLKIGGSSRYWNGDIPVIKVHSRVLTAEEVKQNFNAYKNRFTI
jgi:hypothetical protein